MTLLESTTPVDPRVTSPLFAPEVSAIAMPDSERLMMTYLATLLLDPNYQAEMALSALYYDGLNNVPSLGISIPPELESLRGILGWCAAGIDARSERLNPLGFRMPGKTTTDDDLQKTWQANNMDAESGLVIDDHQIYGRSFVTVGAVDADRGEPLITVESPRNMIGSWDVRRRCLSGAFKTYLDIDPASETYLHQLATLYTRTSTVQLSLQSKGWQVDSRNDRTGDAQFVPVHMFAHNPSIRNRWGSSAMNAAWRNTQDRACRTLVRSEVAGEFYAMMKLILLGVSKESFKNQDGTYASAWETFAGRLSTLEADEAGVLPQVEVVRGDSPDGFIRSLDKEAHIMSGHTGLAPQYHGIFSDGNSAASADAIRMSDFRLKTIADRMSINLGDGFEHVMRMCRKIKGTYIESDMQMETDWAYTGIPTPNADAVTVSTQVQAGMIPPRSDDALAAVGWTALQRKRIGQDWTKADGMAALNNALAGVLPGLKPPAAGQPGKPAQPMDGQQPQALAALNSQRTTDNGANAG